MSECQVYGKDRCVLNSMLVWPTSFEPQWLQTKSPPIPISNHKPPRNAGQHQRADVLVPGVPRGVRKGRERNQLLRSWPGGRLCGGGKRQGQGPTLVTVAILCPPGPAADMRLCCAVASMDLLAVQVPRSPTTSKSRLTSSAKPTRKPGLISDASVEGKQSLRKASAARRPAHRRKPRRRTSGTALKP